MGDLLQSESAPSEGPGRIAAQQTEFALEVAVCAWCRPRGRSETSSLRSHGICPRHFRKIERELKGIVLPRRARSRPMPLDAEALLPF
jgi:hypothetical protein